VNQEQDFPGFSIHLMHRLIPVYGENFLNYGNVDEYWINEANYDFYVSVYDPLRDLTQNVIELAELFSSEGRKSMIYGAGRRASDIWLAYKCFQEIASPNRKSGLNSNERDVLSKELNSIYINTRGVLDNWAQALLLEFDPYSAANLKPVNVGLFNKCIMGNATFQDLTNDLNSIPSGGQKSRVEKYSHNEWFNTELKARRDESAHRIPLHVIQVLTEADQEIFYRLTARRNELLSDVRPENAANNIVEAARYHKEASSIGLFAPYFICDPDGPQTAFYPTIPEDMRRLILIFRCIKKFVYKNRMVKSVGMGREEMV